MINDLNQKQEEDKPHFYITFGSRHTFYPGSFKVYAPTELEARKKAFQIVGSKFCTSYTPEKFEKIDFESQMIHRLIDDENSIKEALLEHIRQLNIMFLEEIQYDPCESWAGYYAKEIQEAMQRAWQLFGHNQFQEV
jgi:hypothetical protein